MAAAPPLETEESNDTVSAQASAEEENSGLASSDGIGDEEAPRTEETEVQEAVVDNARRSKKKGQKSVADNDGKLLARREDGPKGMRLKMMLPGPW